MILILLEIDINNVESLILLTKPSFLRWGKKNLRSYVERWLTFFFAKLISFS